MESFKLYKKQYEKAQLIYKGLAYRHFCLLTGEVGVGKTFMGTWVIREYLEDNPSKKVLVISPKHVISKWKETLELANVNMNDVKIKSTFSSNDLINVNFVVYDEIHTIKTKVKHFTDYIARDKTYVLGLTGSIIDKDINDITNITNFFSSGGSNFLRYIDAQKSFESKQKYVRNYIEPLLTVGLSKDDVKEIIDDTDENKIKIFTDEISITMTNEERAFYEFLTYRLQKLGLPPNKKLSILNAYLDRQKNTIQYIPKNFKEKYIDENKNECTRTNKLYYYIGDKLHRDTTQKDYEINKLLQKYSNNVLIYTLDNEIAKRISNKTSAVYVDTSKTNAVNLINELVIDNPVVFNILPILEGVDLHADNIIWYQTPLTLVQEIQGVGRITRLSSSNNDKKVIYLYHQNTMQEDQIITLRENHKLNNEMIAKKENTEMKSTMYFVSK